MTILSNAPQPSIPYTELANNTQIELSVIIATYNRATMLRNCLDALFHQTQPTTDFEVIVVIDGSTDGTREMLAELIAPCMLRVYWQTNSGVGAARNRGVEAANGRYCLFLDDDIIADPELVAQHLRVQRQQQGVVGLGHITCQLPKRADGFARYLAHWWQDHYARLKQNVRLPVFTDCYTGNLSVPREALLQVGGFAVDLPRDEDVELGYRIQRQGLRFVYIPDAIGHQLYRKGFDRIARDAELEGVASVELYRRHSDILPHLGLGAFNNTRIRAILLRRAMLALRIPIRPLKVLDAVMRRKSWALKWYQFLYSYCYWRGVQRAMSSHDTWWGLTHGTPILMYHAFGAPDEPPSRFIIPANRFARQMAWLKWRRYSVLSLEEFLRYRQEHRLPPARSVVITIDDGYADNRTLAYPILRRRSFPATIFLVSRMIGGVNGWDRDGELAGRALLSCADIHEMSRGGIAYGAHTRSHTALTAVSEQLAEDEIAGSRAELEQALGMPIVVFAYPFGEYDSTSLKIVEQTGFLGACGIRSGLNTPATLTYALHRTEIYGTDTFVHFLCALWLGDIKSSLPRWKRR